MRLQRGSRTATIAVLVMFGAATTTVAHAQSTDELKQRIEELERSPREQVDALKRMLQQHDAPVGESVSSALLPAAAPGGGNNASREAFRAFVSRTRLNLALQGPETLGAKTSAYFEMDFNQTASGSGEVKAANNNPRLRCASGRWAFPNFLASGNELIWTFGQGDAFDQITPDTIDYNTLLAGLGDAERRNPRVEVVDKFPLTSNEIGRAHV